MSRYGKKTEGTLHIKVVLNKNTGSYDYLQAQTGAKLKIIFPDILWDKLLDTLSDAEERGDSLPIYAKKLGEGSFKFVRLIPRIVVHGIKKKIEKKMKYEELLRECDKTSNPANNKIKQKMAYGRIGIMNTKRTSGKIGSALIKSIDNSEENRNKKRINWKAWERKELCEQQRLRIKEQEEKMNDSFAKFAKDSEIHA